MTLSYAGVPLGVSPPDIEKWVEENVPSRSTYEQDVHYWPGQGVRDEPMAWAVYRRPVKIGTLFWPRGASLWAVAHFLVTDKELKEIEAKVYVGTYRAQTLVMGDVTADMWLLPARPLAVNGQHDHMYLLTLVDDRFWWWARDTGDLAFDEGTTTWAQLFDALGAALGVEINADAIDPHYLKPSGLLAAKYRSVPPLLDAAASAVGMRVVRQTNGKVELLSWSTSDQRLRANLRQNLGHMAGGRFRFADRHKELESLVPATFRAVFPRSDSGTPGDGAYVSDVSLASLALPEFAGVTGYNGVKTVHAAAVANYTEGGTLENQAELDGLARAAARDWYRHALGYVDAEFAAVVPWTAEGLSGAVEWRLDGTAATTRVWRAQWFDGPELASSGAHGSRSEDPCCAVGIYSNESGLQVSSPTTFYAPVTMMVPYFVYKDADGVSRNLKTVDGTATQDVYIGPGPTPSGAATGTTGTTATTTLTGGGGGTPPSVGLTASPTEGTVGVTGPGATPATGTLTGTGTAATVGLAGPGSNPPALTGTADSTKGQFGIVGPGANPPTYGLTVTGSAVTESITPAGSTDPIKVTTATATSITDTLKKPGTSTTAIEQQATDSLTSFKVNHFDASTAGFVVESGGDHVQQKITADADQDRPPWVIKDSGGTDKVYVTEKFKLVAAAGTPGSAGLNLPEGVAPDTPAEGDVVKTAGGFYGYHDGAWRRLDSPLTAKGDLYAFSDKADRLPVGTDGQILSADSSEPTGLKWIDPPTGGGSGGGSGTPTWVKVTKTFSDLAVAAAINMITLHSAPARSVLHAVIIKTSEAFAGGSLFSYLLDVFVMGDTFTYVPFMGYDGAAPVSDTHFLDSSNTELPRIFSFAGWDVNLQATGLGDNLDQATQGSVDVYLLISTLPE